MADSSDTAEWRSVQGFPDYEVSDDGRVKLVIAVRNGRIRELKCCVGASGYKMVSLYNAGTKTRGRMHLVHRLVAIAFLGDPPSATHEVAHNDGDPLNNSLSNIRWATSAENQRDRFVHGTSSRGVQNGRAILTEAEVRFIRHRAKNGEVGRAIARQMGLSHWIVKGVISRRTWRHVE